MARRCVALRRSCASRVALLASLVVMAPLVFAASGSTAFASSGWQPAAVLASALQDSSVNVAVDAKGDALAVWTAGLEASNPYASDQADVYSSYRPAGSGNWSKALAIGIGIYDLTPAVAFDGAGNATAAWMSGHTVLLASTRSATTGRWAKPKQVSPAGENPSPEFLTALGVDAEGDAVLAWTTQRSVEVSYRPSGRGWQPPTERAGNSVAVAVASDGSMLLTILNAFEVEAVTGFRGAWDPPVNLGSDLGGPEPPAPAIAPGGDATVVWTSRDPGFNNITHAAVRTAGVWQPEQPISFLDGDASPYPWVGIDARANILAVFQSGSDADATFRPVGAAWQRPVLVGLESISSTLAMNAAGQAVLLGSVGVNFSLAAADYAPGIGWGPAQTLNDERYRQPAAVAIDPAGDAIALWEHNAPDGSAIESAVLDAGGPLQHAVFNHTRPRISGSARPGGKLRCATGTWSGATPISYRFRWLRGTHTVGGLQTYRVARADTSHRLSCHVTATNNLSSKTANSPPLRVYGEK